MNIVSWKRRGWMALACLALGWIVSHPPTALAQTPTPPVPAIPKVHTVQEGENLYLIAQQYGLTVDDLLRANNLSETSILTIGQTLVIPGAAGEPVELVYQVQVGDTLAGVAQQFRTSPAAISAANGIINPQQLIASQTLRLESQTGSSAPAPLLGEPYVVNPGDTWLMLAARAGISPAELAALNHLPYPARLYTGQRLRLPGNQPYHPLPGGWRLIQVNGLPLTQGQTFSLYIESIWSGEPFGRIYHNQAYSQTLRFAPHGEGYVALVGLDAFTPVGLYTLELHGSGSRPWEPWQQSLPVLSGGYGFQTITVPETLSPLLDPSVRASDDALLAPYYQTFSPTPQWRDLFQPPSASAFLSAPYGDARSYNGGPVSIFHTGVDYAGPVGQDVLAPADGVVIFNGLTPLRGQVLILDHGLGVTTGYYHLSAAPLAVGERVTTGQVIGALGSSGLSTGPHLHWELRVHNVAVNALQWLTTRFP